LPFCHAFGAHFAITRDSQIYVLCRDGLTNRAGLKLAQLAPLVFSGVVLWAKVQITAIEPARREEKTPPNVFGFALPVNHFYLAAIADKYGDLKVEPFALHP
jgi:hypothetical protein